MTETSEIPKFKFGRDIGVKTVHAEDADRSLLKFNVKIFGPRRVEALRQIEYGPEGSGFSQATFGELFTLVYMAQRICKAEETRAVGNSKAAQLRKRLKEEGLAGKTTVFGGTEGILVSDENPPEQWYRDKESYE